VDREHAMTKTDHVSLLRQGKAVWSAWREANPSIHPDLGKANLSRANLTDAILNGCDFSGADLSGANLSRANLGRAILRNANLSRANLSEANLGAADLGGSNLSLANFTGATLSDADLSGASLSAQLTGVQWQLRAMRGCYLGVRGLDSCFGNALFKRAAADQDFLDTLEAHLKGTRGMALFRAWGLIDYGRSLLRVAAISFGLAGFYGVIYRIFPHILDYKDSANTWFTPYYFSIVTYTTLGLVMCGRRRWRAKSSSAARLFSATRSSVCFCPSSRKASRAAAGLIAIEFPNLLGVAGTVNLAILGRWRQRCPTRWFSFMVIQTRAPLGLSGGRFCAAGAASVTRICAPARTFR
jgi:uncharacterized protein YjbI with pentapeptide repeats